MAKLTAAKRNALPSSAFVFPKSRRYPIHDENHARDALSRVAANGSPEEKAAVRAAVRKRFPSIDQEPHDAMDYGEFAKARRKQVAER